MWELVGGWRAAKRERERELFASYLCNWPFVRLLRSESFSFFFGGFPTQVAAESFNVFICANCGRNKEVRRAYSFWRGYTLDRIS